MILETIRVSKRARDQLIWLKRQTKIENWNILCRWALFESLKETSVPVKEVTLPDSPIEMTWKTFAGANDEVIAALIRQRCVADGIEPSEKNCAVQLKLHLHRGIRYLFSDKSINSIADLVEKGYVETKASIPRQELPE